MRLTAEQRLQFHKLLLQAFPTRALLEAMVDLYFHQNLAIIAANGPLPSMVLSLMQWAEAHDQTDGLIRAACAANSDAKGLQTFAQEVGVVVQQRLEVPTRGEQSRLQQKSWRKLGRSSGAGLWWSV